MTPPPMEYAAIRRPVASTTNRSSSNPSSYVDYNIISNATNERSSKNSNAVWRVPMSIFPTLLFSIISASLLVCLFCSRFIKGHWLGVTKNEWYTEFWPSISSTIGDYTPQRYIFRFGMALISGPKILAIFLQYHLFSSCNPEQGIVMDIINKSLFANSWVRALSVAGWVFVASGENLFIHEASFIFYVITSILEKIFLILLVRNAKSQPQTHREHGKWARSLRMKLGSFAAYLIFMGIGAHFVVQHKIHRVEGAFATYAIFEWSLVVAELFFELSSAIDFEGIELIFSNDSVDLAGFGAATDLTEQARKLVAKRRWAADIAIDTSIGYLFWSIFISLVSTSFFFPLVDMSFTGFEVGLIAPVLTAVLAVPSIRRLFNRFRILFFLASHLTILSVFYTKDPLWKLIITIVGVGINFWTWWAVFWSSNKFRRDRLVFGLMLGLIVLLCVRLAFLSLNPIFTNAFWNKIGIGFSFLLAFAMMLTSSYGPSADQYAVEPRNQRRPAPIVTGCGLGLALFIIQWLYTEHGIIARWTTVDPFPSGCLVILAIGIGVLLSVLMSTSVLRSKPWFAIGGAAGSLLLYYGQREIGVFGGLLLGVYITSVFPTTFEDVYNSGNIAKTMAAAGLANLVWNLGSLYVVAYPFVPFGELLRERPHWVLFTAMIIIGFSLFTSSISSSEQQQHQQRASTSTVPSFTLRKAVTAIVVLLLFLTPTSFYRAGRHGVIRKPYVPEAIHAMIWTIHFGYDNFGADNFELVRDFIKNAKADVFGILESDMSRTFMGNRDMVEFLETELEMYSDFGPSTRDNTWGCALLSVYPIEKAEHIIMPSPEGELACLINSFIRVNGTLVNVLVAHFGNTQHTLDLKLQTESLINTIRSNKDHPIHEAEKQQALLRGEEYHYPTIFLGYMTMAPFSERFHQVIGVNSTGGMMDTAPEYVDRYCEYVLYKDLNFHGFKTIDRGDITDTEAQTGLFTLLPSGARKRG